MRNLSRTNSTPINIWCITNVTINRLYVSVAQRLDFRGWCVRSRTSRL